jgi:hypothetical protein
MPNATISKPKPPLRSTTKAHLVEKAQKMQLDELISLVASSAKYTQLTAKDELELNAAYMEFQQSLYLIAYKKKLEIGPCLQYVGQGSSPRGSTNYNNFCRFDPVCSKVYSNSESNSFYIASSCFTVTVSLGDAKSLTLLATPGAKSRKKVYKCG